MRKEKYGVRETEEFLDDLNELLSTAILKSDDGDLTVIDLVLLTDKVVAVYDSAGDYEEIMLECGELSEAETKQILPKAIDFSYNFAELIDNLINLDSFGSIESVSVTEEDIVVMRTFLNSYKDLVSKAKELTDDKVFSTGDLVLLTNYIANFLSVASKYKDIYEEVKDLDREEAKEINGIFVSCIYSTIRLVKNIKDMFAENNA